LNVIIQHYKFNTFIAMFLIISEIYLFLFRTHVTLDEAGKFLAWHSYKKDATGWELDGLINNEVLLAKR
ncbi:hypothetical protein J8873_04000, partial [Phocaeicola dorei]|nr:hypothetical protein [Phocaeicola dorei]